MKINGFAFGSMLVTLVLFIKHVWLDNDMLGLLMLFSVVLTSWAAFKEK